MVHNHSPAKECKEQLIGECLLDKLEEVALNSVDHVGAANYASRESEAKEWIREAFEEARATSKKQDFESMLSEYGVRQHNAGIFTGNESHSKTISAWQEASDKKKEEILAYHQELVDALEKIKEQTDEMSTRGIAMHDRRYHIIMSIKAIAKRALYLSRPPRLS